MSNDLIENRHPRLALPIGRIKVPKFLYIILVVLVLAVGGLSLYLKISGAKLSNLEIAKKTLDWIDEQRDKRGIYIDIGLCNYQGSKLNCQSDDITPSNRAFISVLWARYRYYLATKDSEQLSLLKSDIKLIKEKIVDDPVNYTQNNSYNCFLMKDLWNDIGQVFSVSERENIKEFCTESRYELLVQDAMPNEVFKLFAYQMDPMEVVVADSSGAIAVSGEEYEKKREEQVSREKFLTENRNLVTNEDIVKSIKNKLQIISEGKLVEYNLETDSIYTSFQSKNLLSTAQSIYYYYTLDYLARYNMTNNEDDLRMVLVMIDDVLTFYIAEQKNNVPDKNVDCLMTVITNQAKEISELLGISAKDWPVSFSSEDKIAIINSDSNVKCLVARLKDVDEDEKTLEKISRSFLSLNNFRGYKENNDLPFIVTSYGIQGQELGGLLEENALWVGLLSGGKTNNEN